MWIRKLLFLAVASAGLGACTNAPVDREWVGGAFGGNVTYDVRKQDVNHYTLNARAGQLVTKEQLISAAKIKAESLCQPKWADYRYQITQPPSKMSTQLEGNVRCK